MRQRLLKIVKRLLLVLVVLALLGVGGFTWFCYWPLEGRVDDVLALVPENVEFVLRADYDDLESTGWIQTNVLDDPLHPVLADKVAAGLRDAKAQMADLERQINANIPIEALHFGVVDDVLKGEVCVSGRFCRGVGADRAPPSWQEILIMTRVSWKTRCVAALKHEFVRERMGPNLRVSAEDSDIYHLVFPNMPTLPEAQRAVCGGDYRMPPTNEWYLRRVKDVLAISNSRRLIRDVADLADERGALRSFRTRPGYDIRKQSGRITAAVNVEPLHSYLAGAFEYYPELKPLRRFLPPAALERLSGSLSFGGNDLLTGSAAVSYIAQNAPEVVRNVYSLPERAVREGISEMVPAKDTFALLSLRVEPYYLLSSIVDDLLTPDERRLWEGNLRDLEGGFDSLDAFFADLSTRIGTEAMIAVGRLSDVFDQVRHDGFWSNAPHPRPVLAVMVRIKEGASAAELEEYLSSKVPLLGFSRELERVKYRERTYMRTELQTKVFDYQNVQPCFLLANDYLILTTNESYMRQIVDTISDRDVPALERDETFRVTMAPMPERGHVGFFVDVEKLSRIPRDPRQPGPDEQGLMWDGRNAWVLANKDPRSEAIRLRRELQAEARRTLGGRAPTKQQEEEIERKVERHLDNWYELYPRFEDEYRRQVEGFRRLRGLGLVLGATDVQVDASFALILREGEDWLSWR